MEKTTIIRSNERSEVIELISFLNAQASSLNLQIKGVGGEKTIQDPSIKNSMFPDLILFGNVEQTVIVQGWECKMPDVPVTDETLISNAQSKAISLGLNSFTLWNFEDVVIYQRKSGNKYFEIVYQGKISPNIHVRTDVDAHKKEWQDKALEVVKVINSLLVDRSLVTSEFSSVASKGLIDSIVQNNKANLANFYKTLGKSDATIGTHISVWWNGNKSTFEKDEGDMYVAFAKTVILSWCNKLLFASILKFTRNEASFIDKIDGTSTPASVSKQFEDLSSKCDFLNIFGDNGLSGLGAKLDEKTWNHLVQYCEFLTEHGVSSVGQNALKDALEGLIKLEKRSVAGQFTTPTKLAEILVKLTVLHPDQNVLDPCCGSGTFPKAIKDFKSGHLLSEKDILSTTWASDLYGLPIQLTTMALADPAAMKMPLLVFQQDAMTLSSVKSIRIINPSDGSKEERELPKFSAIVTNPPFVAHESIKGDEKMNTEFVSERVSKQFPSLSINAKSDLSYFILLSLWDSLDDDGKIGAVLPIAWLGTTVGKAFFNILTHYYFVESIHTSFADNWFTNADVITSLVVLRKRNVPSEPDPTEQVSFVSWKKKLSDISSDEENIIVESSSPSFDSSPFAELLEKRVLTIERINSMVKMGTSLYSLFFDSTWLLDISSSLKPYTAVFKTKRGERWGCNDFFYLTKDEKSEVEQDYLKPLLKTSSSITRPIAKEDQYAIICEFNKQELRDRGSLKLLHRIEKWERINDHGQVVGPDSVLIKNGRPWYQQDPDLSGGFITSINPNERLFFSYIKEGTVVDQRLMVFKPKKPVNDMVYLALLNSIVQMAFILLNGTPRALGVLDIDKDRLEQCQILDPERLSVDLQKQIIASFAPLLNRDVLPVEEELKRPDRIAFDHVVLKAFGIDNYYDRIHDFLISFSRVRSAIKRNKQINTEK